jgi:hypothetical protein
MGSSRTVDDRRSPCNGGVDLNDMQDRLAVALVIQNVPGSSPRRSKTCG